MHTLVLALLSLAATGISQAQSTTTLYKSVGPDGTVTYGDQPDPQAREAQMITVQNLRASPLSPQTITNLEQLQRPADGHATAVPPSDIVLFTATWCGYCRQAKAYLAGKRVNFREYDVDTKEGLAAYAKAGGGRSGIPLLVADGKRVVGFKTAAYDALFSASK